MQLIKKFQEKAGIRGIEREKTQIHPHGDTIKKMAQMVQAVRIRKLASSGPEILINQPEIKAMLEVIAKAEGLDKNYRRLADGIIRKTGTAKYQEYIGKPSRQVIISLDRHPNISVEWKKGRDLTTAAGRYQFLFGTWEEQRSKWGFSDFGERSQDLCAVALMMRRKMIVPLLSGDFHQAVLNGNQEWASFPESPHEQHPRSWAQMEAYYAAALKEVR